MPGRIGDLKVKGGKGYQMLYESATDAKHEIMEQRHLNNFRKHQGSNQDPHRVRPLYVATLPCRCAPARNFRHRH